MRMRKIVIPLIIGIMFVIVTLAAVPATTSMAETKSAFDSQSGLKNKLLNKIIKLDQVYADYNVDIIEHDFDGDGNTEFFYVFTKKGTSKDDFMGSCADIWYGSQSELSRVLEWQDILPNTYGSLELDGKYYFRYDLAYVTTSRTVLISTNKGKWKEAFSPAGAASFIKESNEFIVVGDSYDMEYSREDKITCGHTWKNYYFYADKKGIHEYGAAKISEKTFFKYPGAKGILKQLEMMYGGENIKLSYKFLKRSNGLLHINVYRDSGDFIDHYFATYRMGDKNKLSFMESDAGLYQTALDKSIAIY